MREPLAPLPLRATAFTAFMDGAQFSLFRFARHLIGEPEQAHDIVQDVFVDAWRTAQRADSPFTDGGDELAMRRWIFHAAYHRAMSVLRRKRVISWESLNVLDPPEPSHYYAPTPFEDRVAEGEALQKALATVTPEDAACVLLNAIYGFTSVEIAQILALTPEAAKKRLSRAKQRLRNAYLGPGEAVLAPREERARS
jgi:RNA polymerase sigma factor (sigma-70 family)